MPRLDLGKLYDFLLCVVVCVLCVLIWATVLLATYESRFKTTKFCVSTFCRLLILMLKCTVHFQFQMPVISLSLPPLQAAFLLPTITRLIKEDVPGASQNDTQSPEVLIISPTRELTLQIYNEARKFVHGSVYRPVVVYGGTSVGHQLAQVERGSNIVVGTPGRLMDFLRRGKVRVRGGGGWEKV